MVSFLRLNLCLLRMAQLWRCPSAPTQDAVSDPYRCCMGMTWRPVVLCFLRTRPRHQEERSEVKEGGGIGGGARVWGTSHHTAKVPWFIPRTHSKLPLPPHSFSVWSTYFIERACIACMYSIRSFIRWISPFFTSTFKKMMLEERQKGSCLWEENEGDRQYPRAESRRLLDWRLAIMSKSFFDRIVSVIALRIERTLDSTCRYWCYGACPPPPHCHFPHHKPYRKPRFDLLYNCT